MPNNIDLPQYFLLLGAPIYGALSAGVPGNEAVDRVAGGPQREVRRTGGAARRRNCAPAQVTPSFTRLRMLA